MSSDTSIFVGALDDVAWIRIEGIATKDTSCGIRGYLSDLLDDGLQNFVIDLEECRLIDSTFIGILSGLAGKLVNGEVKVIHSNERNEKSICKLGLNQLITIERGGLEAEDEEKARACLDLLDAPVEEKNDKASIILQAHEDLCAANEKNVEQFGDVLDFLRKDLKKITNN